MKTITSVIPKVNINKFTEFITSKEIVAVGAAVLVTPFILKSVEAIVKRVPFLKDHFTIGLAIAAFVIFLLSSMVGGILRAIAIGIAGGVLITAIAPFFEDSLRKVFP